MKETHSRLVSEISNLPFLISVRSRVDSSQEACTPLKQSFSSWERRGGLSFPGMSTRFGSLAPPGPRLQSFCVFSATRGFSPHCKSFAGVYMSVGSDLFSSHFFPCLSHLHPPPSCSSSPFSHPSCNFGTASRLLNGEAVKLSHRTICEGSPWVF